MCRLRSVFAPSSEIFWNLNEGLFPPGCAGTESVFLTLVHFSSQTPRPSYIYKTYKWRCSRAVHPRDEKCLNQPSAREYFKFPVEQFGYFLTPTTSYPLAATLHLHFNFIITVDLVGKYETVEEEFSFIFCIWGILLSAINLPLYNVYSMSTACRSDWPFVSFAQKKKKDGLKKKELTPRKPGETPTHCRPQAPHRWYFSERLRFKSTGQFSFASVN